MTVVLFNSVYGSTQQYATELARRLRCDAHPLEAPAHYPDGPIIVCSPCYGPTIAGAQFIKDTPLDNHPVALVVVGMSLVDYARAKDAAAGLLGTKKDTTVRFYLPGRLNYSQLSRVHKGILWSVVNVLKRKSNRSDNDNSMIETYGHDTDRVDFSELEPIITWAQSV